MTLIMAASPCQRVVIPRGLSQTNFSEPVVGWSGGGIWASRDWGRHERHTIRATGSLDQYSLGGEHIDLQCRQNNLGSIIQWTLVRRLA